MKEGTVYKDERTTSVENASYRWAFTMISYGLLLDVAYRGWVRREAAWDLLGLVILAGVVSFFYQYTRRILNRGWVMWAVVTALTAAVVAIVLSFVR